jgi:multidrug resistance efflux pump
VVQVLKDNGEAVRKGELLVQLDDTAIRDSLASAAKRCAPPPRLSSRPSARCSG